MAATAAVSDKPVPAPDEISEPFWSAIRSGRFAFQYCEQCNHFIHAPRLVCPHCGNENLVIRDVSGKGTVRSFTIIREQATRGFPPPYVVAYIDLPEEEGLTFMTNIVGIAPEDVRIGMPVEVTWDQVREDWQLPQFRPAKGVG